MKKTLSMILSALMLAGLATAASAFEKGVDYIVIEETDPDNYVGYGDGYPGSGDWDWPECTSGQLLKGTIISSLDPETGYYCWPKDANGNFTTVGNASAAFDGDTSTLYDPFEATERAWAGMILDEAYELTEARVMVRGKYLERMKNAAIQGSQDGEKWVTIVFFAQNAEAEDYHIFTPDPITDEDYIDAGYTDYSAYWVGSGSYKMYRYINLGRNHGEAIEIELYGNPAPATEVTDELIAATTFKAVNFYNGSYEDTGIQSVSLDGSIVGTVIGAGGSYKQNPDTSYQMAWDNDPATFYDPADIGSNFWTGIKVAEPVALKEVRILPRAEWLTRTRGAHVQGSNDGKIWTTLASFTAEDCLEEQAWIVRPVTVDMKFTMFRYTNDGAMHGDVVDVALFAADGSAVTVPETTAPETTAPAVDVKVSDEFHFYGELVDTGIRTVAPAGIANALVGTVMGAGGTPEANTYAMAFDGNLDTFWTANENKWAEYMLVFKADAPVAAQGFVVATQTAGDGKPIRYHALNTSRIQGSNDGINWTTLFTFGEWEYVEYSEEVAEGNYYYTVTPEDTTTAYTYFRYINNDDGAAALSEFVVLGAAAEAPETTAPETTAPETAAPETAAPETEAPATAAPETTAPTTGTDTPSAPQTFDFGVIAAVAAVVSAAGYAVAKKRK